MHDALIHELDALRARRGYDELTILETGCIRMEDPTYRDSDGWSTLTFAQYVQTHGGTLTSVDLDTSVAQKVLKEAGLSSQATFLDGYSVDVLAGMIASERTFDVIMLDTENDAQLVLHEYLVAKRLCTPGTLIIFDDVDMTNISGAVKGHQVVPWFDHHGIPYRMKQRISDQYVTNMVFTDAA